MPIRPENRARYPKDWKAIVAQVRERSGNRCECEGECGTKHAARCNVPNESQGYRGPDGRFYLAAEMTLERMAWIWGMQTTPKLVRIVLTTAHLDHVPEHCDPSNLKHMCQRCHLAYDRDHHAQTRARTKREGKAVGELVP